MRMRRIPIAAALAPALCVTAALAQDWQGFPPYPASKALCDQRVHGSTREIHWSAYTSGDSPQAVVAFYASKLGKPKADPDGTRFSIGSDDRAERILAIYPVDGSYPRCGKDPAPGDRTVLIISRAITR